jgi:hypothetical protein
MANRGPLVPPLPRPLGVTDQRIHRRPTSTCESEQQQCVYIAACACSSSVEHQRYICLFYYCVRIYSTRYLIKNELFHRKHDDRLYWRAGGLAAPPGQITKHAETHRSPVQQNHEATPVFGARIRLEIEAQWPTIHDDYDCNIMKTSRFNDYEHTIYPRLKLRERRVTGDFDLPLRGIWLIHLSTAYRDFTARLPEDQVAYRIKRRFGVSEKVTIPTS